MPPLPDGWTEHKAPTGHSYYYNASTQVSTYTRPIATLSQPNQYPDAAYSHSDPLNVARYAGELSHPPGFGPQAPIYTNGLAASRLGGNDRRQRPQPKDRPKSKHAIPGCEPWVLVNTKLGRRFVYNPEQNESHWKFPPDLMKAVIEYDRVEREKKVQEQRTSVEAGTEPHALKVSQEKTTVAPGAQPLGSIQQVQNQPAHDSDDEYEEVEVTDDEADEETATKRRKTEDSGTEQPVEFNEDDIAYQLAAMGQDYGLDPGEYGDVESQDLEEGAQGLPLSEEDACALFHDMLDDHSINPYSPWETVIEEGHIVEDDRYTILPNMKTRKEVWGEWSRDRIQKLKDQREKESKTDPRIPYLAFLQAKATPKLYWPEFRRKYMKEPEMRNTKLSDKEREKWFRDYINRLKLPESTLKSDLVSMLKSVSPHTLNRSSSIVALPPAVLTDIRYMSVRPSLRDPLIDTYISTLPEAPETDDASTADKEALVKHKQERERREALAERQIQVQREKRRVKEALEHSKSRMREGEEEVQRAMKVGKEGLLGYMEKDDQPPLP